MSDEYLTIEQAEKQEAENQASGSIRKPKAKPPEVFTADSLGKMVFPPIKYIVPGFIPEGCTLLAGKSKIGKSWLMLDVALAVARDDYCLGDVECEQGSVLFLALEDNLRRLQSRVKKVTPPKCQNVFPEALTFATKWQLCDDGGLTAIRTWAGNVPKPRLVIVDILAYFRSPRGKQDNPYESDSYAIKGLQQLASDLGLAIVIIHHLRKGLRDGDPFEQVSGTMGLTGAADTTLVLDRGGNGCTLYGRGRDIEEFEKAVTFDREICRWTAQGEASEVRRSDERGSILSVLLEAQEPMSPSDIAIMTNMPGNNTRRLLMKMVTAGEVLKAKRGKYCHPSKPEIVTDCPVVTAGMSTPGNNGNKVTNGNKVIQLYDFIEVLNEPKQ